ncbi:hypothetical protein RchiOBHm_Chr3g0486141 [Rosa chinensis]|uniref:Uncharacterized protein n=1 Tax=Rosa chinensis TaxID=74649 RepID=A0A2P6RF59_ROSCH|nr:hypothetical protein RchiOBHm_Chr3g0486141 [Rosa chinensis]
MQDWFPFSSVLVSLSEKREVFKGTSLLLPCSNRRRRRVMDLSLVWRVGIAVLSIGYCCLQCEGDQFRKLAFGD